MDLRYITVEGPIGVGKTTLAHRLAEATGAEMIVDPEQQNPFLESFYKSSGAYALHTQLDFLIRRIDILQGLVERNIDGSVVTDFLLAKDRIFAELTLDENELWIYDRVYKSLITNVLSPSLVIYLQAPTETLMDRIEARGYDFEKGLASGYLQRLADAYSAYFHEYSQSPILIVNAKDIDFAHNHHDFENLLQQITSLDAGRHFLNPLPS